MTGDLTYAGLKELAKELDRPLRTLEVLNDDPFTAGREAPRWSSGEGSPRHRFVSLN
jgi:hypothetical protein